MITPFIDRESEIHYLLKVFEQGFYPILYIYGPEGCGKTRLLKELVRKLVDKDNYFVLYVDALETTDVKRVFWTPPKYYERILDLLGAISGNVGRIVVETISEWLVKLLRRIDVEDKHVVVLVDDVVQSIGLDKILPYSKKLLNLLEEIHELKPRSMVILVTTSEGKSRRILLKHRWTSMRLLWNLDKGSALKLLQVLRVPRDSVNKYVQLTGGNPRAIIELYKQSWNEEEWIAMYRERVEVLIRGLDREQRRQLLEAAENPDALLDASQELVSKLIDFNMIIELPNSKLRIGGKPYKPDPTLGIGEHFAWQTPVYAHIVKQLAYKVD